MATNSLRCLIGIAIGLTSVAGCGESIHLEREPPPQTMIDIRETVDNATGAVTWKTEVHNPELIGDGFLLRTYDANGKLTEERQVDSATDLLSPGLQSLAAALSSDPMFVGQMDQLRQNGVSLVDATAKLSAELADEMERRVGSAEPLSGDQLDRIAQEMATAIRQGRTPR